MQDLSFWNAEQNKAKVPFWDPSKLHLKERAEIDAVFKEIMDSGNFVLGYGDYIEKFEREFAEYIGVKHAIMCGGGTHALLLSYKALGIGPRDEVIVPSHTFIATIDQIVAVGATPILVDIGEDGLMDPVEVQKAITLKTKAIVPVHLEGKICDIDAIREAMEKRCNIDDLQRPLIPIVEDAAQAIGAKGINQGYLTCYSFYPAKVLGGIGNAGMVTTNDNGLAHRVRLLRANSLIGKTNDFDNVEFGYQLEPDSLCAAVLSIKLKNLDANLARRREIGERYNRELSGLPIKLPLQQEGRIYQDYVIRVNVLEKPHLLKWMSEHGVGYRGDSLIPNHAYKKILPFELFKTDEYIAEQIRIPCNHYLTDEEVGIVINVIKEFYEKSTL